MSTQGRNVDGNIAYIRDTFLNTKGEHSFLQELIKDKNNIKKINEYRSMPLKKVVAQAKAIINAMEVGIYKDKSGNHVVDEKTSVMLEKELVLLLASIEDAILAKILELTPDEDITLLS